jgi:DGQHR domain-containing protein
MATDTFPGVVVQSEPLIVSAVIPGRWLLRHCTPSWRAQDPEAGFQRMVSESRARSIAAGVLDQQRTFPNAIVLATDSTRIAAHDCHINMPGTVKFLVVDGQHRLWAQHYSEFDAQYACTIHVGLSEQRMAELFLEINDNQKRVPSSLRWDLVRLVETDEDQPSRRAADLVYELATDVDSPLYQRIDLTGENPEISLKQGSIAPEVKRLVSLRESALFDIPYETQYVTLRGYFAAIRERDADGWASAKGALYKARVIRGLLRVLSPLLEDIGRKLELVRARDFLPALRKLDLGSLSDEALRTKHGNAGIAQITQTIHDQVIGPQ